MAAAYAAVADDGMYHSPSFIDHIVDRSGCDRLHAASTSGHRVVSTQIARGGDGGPAGRGRSTGPGRRRRSTTGRWPARPVPPATTSTPGSTGSSPSSRPPCGWATSAPRCRCRRGRCRSGLRRHLPGPDLARLHAAALATMPVVPVHPIRTTSSLPATRYITSPSRWSARRRTRPQHRRRRPLPLTTTTTVPGGDHDERFRLRRLHAHDTYRCSDDHDRATAPTTPDDRAPGSAQADRSRRPAVAAGPRHRYRPHRHRRAQLPERAQLAAIDGEASRLGRGRQRRWTPPATRSPAGERRSRPSWPPPRTAAAASAGGSTEARCRPPGSSRPWPPTSRRSRPGRP